MSPPDKCSLTKCVAYLLVVLNMIAGILYFMGILHNPYTHKEHSILNNSPINIFAGTISVCLGLLLLYGIIKKHATCVLVYFILMCLGAVAQTAFIGYSVMTASVPPQATMFAVGLIIVTWAAAYCVYLFYRDLKTSQTKLPT